MARAIGKDASYINRLFYPQDKKGAKGIGQELMDATRHVRPASGLLGNDSQRGFRGPGVTNAHGWRCRPETSKRRDFDSTVFDRRCDGGGLVLRDQPGVIKSWSVSREWAQKNLPYVSAYENLAIVTGFGDSMLGMFNPGDPLLVDKGVRECEFDGVYFFDVDGEGFIKRLQRIPGEGILVISENKRYRDWYIKPGMNFQILAKVLRAWESKTY